jgi:hypothetical protein
MPWIGVGLEGFLSRQLSNESQVAPWTTFYQAIGRGQAGASPTERTGHKKDTGPGQSQRESRSARLAAILPARHQASHHPLESQREHLTYGCSES